MKRWASSAFALLLAGVVSYSCVPASDKKDDSSANAGSAGTGAAAAGSAGHSGSSSVGEAGASLGGASDTAGAPGAAGAAGEGTGAAAGEGNSGGASGGSGGSGGSSSVIDTAGAAGTDDEGPPATLVWHEDFESGAPDWNITGGVWAFGAPTNTAGPTPFEGTKVAGTGLTTNYPSYADAWLTSPTLAVPAAKENPRFRIRYWYDLAAGDTAYIAIRVGTGPWQTVTTLSQAGDGAWRQFAISLKAYANESVQFGFRLVTDGAAFDSGLFLDDARFETGNQPFDHSEGFENDWGYWWAQNGVWELGAPTAADGPKPFEGNKVAGTILTDDYLSYEDAWLISPLIDVPSADLEPRVSLAYWYDLAAGDTAYTTIRADGGPWQTLSTLTQSGDGSWRNLTYSLTPYANRTVEIGTRIVTDGTAFAAGVYVDDFRYETGPIQLTTTQGFENGFDGWSAYNGVWAVGKPTASAGPSAHGGTAVAGTILSGNYPAYADAWLVSPRIAVPHASVSPTFSYWYWYELASGDTSYVAYRIDGGPWQTIDTLTLSGSNVWRQKTIDLTPYKDHTIEFGFRLVSDGSTFAPGFYVDDVAIKL